MTDKPSWRLKLSRAEKHLGELNGLLAPLRESHDYVVRESVEEDHAGKRIWVYRAFSDLEIEETVPVVLGDLLFNVRSALDHMAVAAVPNRRKAKASFPIFTIDPEQDHPGDEKGDAARREAWENATKEMVPAALQVVRASQPSNNDPGSNYSYLGLRPEDHVLALLSAFQNADKHRRLVTAVSGLLIESVQARHDNGLLAWTATGDRNAQSENNVTENGAVIYAGPTQMEVSAVGSCRIVVRSGGDARGDHREIPEFPAELLKIAHVLADTMEVALGHHGPIQ